MVKLLLGHGADLLARDSEGHLAMCRAVRQCHVEVVNILLEAHTAQENGNGSMTAVVECPCVQDEDEQGYPPIPCSRHSARQYARGATSDGAVLGSEMGRECAGCCYYKSWCPV